MIPVNRETLTLIATVICMVGMIFLFREMNRTKQEMANFKNFSEEVVQHMNTPKPKAVESAPVPPAEIEPKTEE
jgi:hypothetical protein